MAGVKNNTYKIKVYDKEKNAYYSVTVECNISSGHGVVGAYGYSQYDVNWSGTSSTTPQYYETSDTMAIEVHNVSGYEIDRVEVISAAYNLSGPTSMSGGKYWTFKLSNNCRLRVVYRSSITYYHVSTSVTPSGGGRLEGGGDYSSGSSVTITAYPSTNYALRYIVDTQTGGQLSSPYTFNIYQNRSFQALFYKAKSTITVNVSPNGAGTTSGGGNINVGAQTTLIAYPNEGYIFSYWIIDGVRYDENNVRYTVTDRDITATAYFQTVSYVDLTSTCNLPSKVSVTGTGRVVSGIPHTITVSILDSEYHIDHYEINGTYHEPDNPLTVTPIVDTNVHIVLAQNTFNVVLKDSPNDSGKLRQRNFSLSTITWYGREHDWVKNTFVEMEALSNEREDSSQPSTMKFWYWLDGPNQDYNSKHVINVQSDRELRAFYQMKRRWDVSIMYMDEASDCNTSYSFKEGEGTRKGAQWFTLYELDAVTLHTVVNNHKYVFDKMTIKYGEEDEEVLTTDPSNITVSLREITNAEWEANYVQFRIYTRQQTTTTRTVYVGVFPTNAGDNCYVKINGYYYDPSQGKYVYDTWYARTNAPANISIPDGARLFMWARGDGGETPWAFDYWNGDIPEEAVKYNTSIDVYVNKDMRFYANFQYAITFQVFCSPDSGGTVRVEQPAEYIGNNTYRIAMGRRLELTAIPYTGYQFNHWTFDGRMGTYDPHVVIASMSSQDYHLFRAYFKGGEGFVTLSVYAKPSEGGYVTIDGVRQEEVSKEIGSTATIKAIANEGWVFDGWIEDVTKSDTIVVTMDQRKWYSAKFKQVTPPPTPETSFDILSWWASRKRRKRKTILLK